MDTRTTGTAIEIGWFLATIVGLHYTIKSFGIVRTLSWTFAISSLVGLGVTLLSVCMVYQRALLNPLFLLVPGVLSMQAAIFAVAWWTIRKRKPSARVWGVAASLTYILPTLFIIFWKIHRSRAIRDCTWIMLAIGVVGVVAFLRSDMQHEPNPDLP